jgi:endonuclease-8
LTKTDFRVPRYATLDLSGHRLMEVVPRGKHILMRIADGSTIHTHFKMEGEWHLYRPGERWHGPGWQVRVLLETEAWVAVGFRLGIVDVFPTLKESDVVGHLGPDLLGPDWDAARAESNLSADPDRPLGAALLDQTVMAGLGNVFKSEICFLSGLNPWTRVGDVPDLGKVVDLSKRTIEANRETGMQITTGDNRPGRRHWVYGRKGEPCRRCRTPISKQEEVVGTRERVTYWCPNCQPASR